MKDVFSSLFILFFFYELVISRHCDSEILLCNDESLRQTVRHLTLFINPYQFLTTARIWRLSNHVQTDLGPTQPPVSRYGGSFPRVKRPEIDVQPSPLSSVEVGSVWSYASAPHLYLQSVYELYLPLLLTTLLKHILPRKELGSTPWKLNIMTLSSWYH